MTARPTLQLPNASVKRAYLFTLCPEGDFMATLERAIAIAAKAHEGQVDKAGAPYIIHPLRVMMRVASTEERIAAVLHDVVEDTDINFDNLRAEGFSESVLSAVESLTKRANEDYDAFILRAAADPIGRKVKLADLAENSDLTRISNPTDKDHERVAKYRRAIDKITSL
jgi:(p)ppGpp synthase/HD superfamily hydrolase